MSIRMVLDLTMNRIFGQPSKDTFTILPISQLLAEEVDDPTRWVDPFAGFHSIVPVSSQNDLNPATPAHHHRDALEWLRRQTTEEYDGVLYDPPYSMRQAQEVYESFGGDRLVATVVNMKYWAQCRDEAARIVKPGGKAISFGWNTTGLGNQRLFQLDRVLIVPHGGARNDTLVTGEHKKGGRLL